jgi:hypothetical protein
VRKIRLSPILALAFLGFLASPAAFAGGMNPVGYNAWDYYVFGNGPAIYHILQSIKLLMAPNGGGGMFESLLTALALFGAFLVIVEAGFSPSKGVERLIGYFLMLLFVVFFTLGARVNVTIVDNASGYYNTVTGVPALVGVPASLISEIGYHLEQGIEQDFSIPSGLKLSRSGIYDVMGRTLQDANRMTITNPNLKRDLSGYVENCVVPEIGLGRVSVNGLMSSGNVLKTFGAAATPSLLTPVYSVTGSAPATSFSNDGTLEQCSTAYGSISTDVTDYANALTNAQTSQWQTTGIMIPFGTAMQDVLQEAAAGGGGNPTVSGYASPESYILQSAMLNTSRRAFQRAAAELGENPVMLSTAISQADQAQRSSWYTTITVFQNMIGYVYIVLQAFVLAMVPIIAVMLLIPGLGSKIFVNYIQVLLWLVLWGPLFAIDNFIVDVYGAQRLHNLLAPGLTMLNYWAVSKATVNLELAAAFLGTLIPLLAWGIVKGSFAFTEMILTGMGTAFGQQAGSIAASGNISLGNTSLDNVGMDKYSTSITSDIGDNGVNLGVGAGAGVTNIQRGGYSLTAGKTTETPTRGYSDTWSATMGRNTVANLTRNEAESIKANMAAKASRAHDFQQGLSNSTSQLQDYVDKHGIHTNAQAQLAASAAEKYAQASQIMSQHSMNAGVSVGLGKEGLKGGVSAGGDLMVRKAHELKAEGDADVKRMEQLGTSYSKGQDANTKDGWDVKGTEGSAYKEQYDTGLSVAHDASVSLSKSISEMDHVQISEGYGESFNQTMLGGPVTPGEVAVRPSDAVAAAGGGAPLTAGGVRGLEGAGSAAGAAARVAGTGAGSQIGSLENDFLTDRTGVLHQEGSLTPVAAGERQKIADSSDGVVGKVRNHSAETQYDVRSDPKKLARLNTQVKTASILDAAYDGGVGGAPTLKGAGAKNLLHDKIPFVSPPP